jgi:hypothetical protein
MRGVGKTVLLRAIEDRVREYGWHTPGIQEARPDRDPRHMLVTMTQKLLLEFSTMRRLRDRVRKAQAVLAGFALAASERGVELRLEVDPHATLARSGDIEQDLTDLFIEIGQVAEAAGTGAIFLLDEVHTFPRKGLEALAAALHQVSQQSLPLSVIAAGLPHMAGLMTEAKSYSERLFSFAHIGALSAEAARDALAIPAEQLGVTFDGTALDVLIEGSERYPYFLQEYGNEAWNVAEQNCITLDDARDAIILAHETLDSGFFRARYEKGSPAGRRYMQAMASLGKGPFPSRDVSRQLGSKRQPSPTDLLTGGLVYEPQLGFLEFTVPLFADYVRRHHPL